MANLVMTAVDYVSPILRKMGTAFDKADKKVRTFDTSLKSVGKVTGFKSIGSVVKTLARGFTTLFTSVSRGLVALALDFITVNQKLEDLRIMMNTATGSIEGGARAMEDMIDLSTRAPFSIDALSDAFVKLKTAGLDPMDGTLQVLIDSVAAFGGSSEQLKLVTIAIQQMVGKGVVSMEELRRQFGEQVPTAMRAMAKELGYTMLEMVQKIETGTLDANTGITALVEGLRKIHTGAAEVRMDSFTGAITLLRTQWMLLLRDIGTGDGAFNSIAEVLRVTARALNDFRNSIEGAAIIEDLSEKINAFMLKFSKNPQLIQEAVSKFVQTISTFMSSILGSTVVVIKVLDGFVRAMYLIKAAVMGAAAVLSLYAAGLFKVAQAAAFLTFQTDLAKTFGEYATYAKDSALDLGEKAGEAFEIFAKGAEPLNNTISMLERLSEEAPTSTKTMTDMGTAMSDFNESTMPVAASIDNVTTSLQAQDEALITAFENVNPILAAAETDFKKYAINAAKSIADLAQKIADKNKEIEDNITGLASSIRNIEREGMTAPDAYRDKLLEISEMDVSIKMATDAGDLTTLKGLLLKRQGLIESLETSGSTKIFDEKDIADAEKALEIANNYSGSMLDGFAKQKTAKQDLADVEKKVQDGIEDSITAEEQRATKIALLTTNQEDLNDVLDDEKVALEDKKTAEEDAFEAAKTKFTTLIGNAESYGLAVGEIGEVWKTSGEAGILAMDSMEDAVNVSLDNLALKLTAFKITLAEIAGAAGGIGGTATATPSNVYTMDDVTITPSASTPPTTTPAGDGSTTTGASSAITNNFNNTFDYKVNNTDVAEITAAQQRQDYRG